jgi:hypothetical protein
MIELKKDHFNIILKYIDLLCPNKRTPKYSNEYYLTNILNLLTHVTSWRSLKKTSFYKFGLIGNDDISFSKDNHFKTINSKHIKWSKLGVYEKAYNEILGKKVDNLDGNVLNLIIDATNIINKCGIDGVGYGTESRKKKFTKITIISEGSNVVTVHDHKVNDKDIRFGDKVKKIKTLEHDIKGIIPAVMKIKTNKNIFLAGDKGYIVSEETKKMLKKEHNINIVTPYRKNMKKKNTAKEKKILKTRHLVENSICKIKAFSRIHVRRDKKLINYMGFMYLALIKIS